MRLRTPEEEDGGDTTATSKMMPMIPNAFQCSNHGFSFRIYMYPRKAGLNPVYLWRDPSSLTHDPLRKAAMKAKGGHMSEMDQLSDIETGRCFAGGQLFSTDEELSSHVIEMHANHARQTLRLRPWPRTEVRDHEREQVTVGEPERQRVRRAIREPGENDPSRIDDELLERRSERLGDREYRTRPSLPRRTVSSASVRSRLSMECVRTAASPSIWSFMMRHQADRGAGKRPRRRRPPVAR